MAYLNDWYTVRVRHDESGAEFVVNVDARDARQAGQLGVRQVVRGRGGRGYSVVRTVLRYPCYMTAAECHRERTDSAEAINGPLPACPEHGRYNPNRS